ncbi:sialate O-acetylesterase [Paraflavisolibacter sp. H34]|uniref:sialate O-acetylesterase n=1 Tax=Huijunlia imazamoxiresistens TaxID=3127457 RepID=UPI003017946E
MIACFSLLFSGAQAQIRLPRVIGSNMILQRNQPVPLWGWAKPGATVKLQFANQTQTAVAGADGRWQLQLSPLQASSTPRSLTLTSDTSTVVLDNILVGEVWLCSGQSNMEYQVKKPAGYKDPARGADSAALELNRPNAAIRLFTVEKKLSHPDVTSNGWQESRGAALEQASAAGYFFAKNLQQTLQVPVGIISSSWGGSRIEPWTPPSGYAALPAFRKETTAGNFMIDSMAPGRNFSSMIEPLAPFALKGVLWYQGESNCMLEEPDMRYADKMQALVHSWRTTWKNNSMPFYYVLVAPYRYTRRKDKLPHTEETLPLFWEQQVAAARIPHTGYVTITDLVDNLNDIHPSYKWEVGRRLSLVALAKTYNRKNTVYSGPQLERAKVKGAQLVLSFKNAEGLKTTDGQQPNYFTLAGRDGKFVAANAVISGNTVVLSSPEVAQPVTARFAWTETAQPNLVNAAGLPAVPFRTDAAQWAYKK